MFLLNINKQTKKNPGCRIIRFGVKNTLMFKIKTDDPKLFLKNCF